jgi:predicted nucleic acid-binding protein
MIILDTNVVSELMRPVPDARVIAWVDRQRVTELAITAVTAAELRAGVALLPAGRRRTRIGQHVTALIDETFAGSVLPFDIDSSTDYGEIVGRRHRTGAPISALDAQIAAACHQRAARLATRNVRDFAHTGVDLIDPWAT